MKQTYENDFAMFSTVRDFMNLHTAETSGVPAIGTAVAALVALIAQMDAAAGAQAVPLTGIAEDKDVVRTTLEEAVFIVSEPLSALAAVTNNNTLLDEVSITRSGLDRLSAENLDIWAARVAARAATNQTALTGTYGVTLAQVTAITTGRTAFAPWINSDRNRFEMVKRVAKFRTDNAGLFPVAPTTPPDIKAAALFTTIESAKGAVQGRSRRGRGRARGITRARRRRARSAMG